MDDNTGDCAVDESSSGAGDGENAIMGDGAAKGADTDDDIGANDNGAIFGSTKRARFGARIDAGTGRGDQFGAGDGQDADDFVAYSRAHIVQARVRSSSDELV